MKTHLAAIGKWGLIFKSYGLPPIDPRRHYKGESPCCGRKGKIRIDDREGKGTFICACGEHGNGWRLLEIKTGRPARELLRDVDLIIGNTYKSDEIPVANDENAKLQRFINAWKSGSRVNGTNVESYLNSRGIFTMPARAVKCVNGSMFAIASDDHVNAVYAHITALKGTEKAFDECRKMHSLQPNNDSHTSVAVRLFDMQSTLGIAEGIETALSCKQLYKTNTWATMNTSIMKRFIAPKGVNHLIIYADHDRNCAGLAAATHCANRNILAKNDVEKVTIRRPGRYGDFNDVVQKQYYVDDIICLR